MATEEARYKVEVVEKGEGGAKGAEEEKEVVVMAEADSEREAGSAVAADWAAAAARVL